MEQTITIGCREYDHTQALATGRVKIDGVDLKFVSLSPPSQIFLRMLHAEEFDVSEMSLSNYMIALGKGDRRFIAIPIFPSRAFRHSSIWVNTRSRVETPQDLRGKRLGIADYSMTALLFVRGLLQHQYGVAPEEIHWFRRRQEHVAIDIPPGVRIDNIAQNETLDILIETGKLDALAITSPPRAFLEGSPTVRRLFADCRSVEAEYYLETGIFPIMHTIVMRRAIYQRDPMLALRLAQAFETAKRQALERYEEGLSSLPWANLDLDYAREILGHDIYPYGVAKNGKTLAAATLYSHEQGLTPRRLAIEELFAPETIDLFAEPIDITQ